MDKNMIQELELPEFTVASAYAFGEEPEMKSFSVLEELIRLAGWQKADLESHRLFGFNNPDPSEGSPRYGYENQLTVEPPFRLPEGAGEGLSVKKMAGGLYAALESAGIPDSGKWGGLVTWLNGSRYQYDPSRQWLEELVLDSNGLAMLFGEEVDPDRLTFVLLSPIVTAGEKVEQAAGETSRRQPWAGGIY